MLFARVSERYTRKKCLEHLEHVEHVEHAGTFSQCFQNRGHARPGQITIFEMFRKWCSVPDFPNKIRALFFLRVIGVGGRSRRLRRRRRQRSAFPSARPGTCGRAGQPGSGGFR